MAPGTNPEATAPTGIDGSIVTAEPGTLGRVAVFRAAARQIARHPGLDIDERARGLSNLIRRGRRERFGQMICFAILAELNWSLDRKEVSRRRNTGDVMERRARALRAEGRATCPTCATPLSNETDWAFWAQLRAAAIAEVAAREAAVA